MTESLAYCFSDPTRCVLMGAAILVAVANVVMVGVLVRLSRTARKGGQQ